VLYSGAFRRLAGVTQVAAPLDSHLYHSRLTHSLEVAQIGRRIAERLLAQKPRALRPYLDPDVVEAACLIHDIGHPPFGHVAENELDKLVRSKGNPSGFEGNAQSFRIVSRLAVHREEYEGLDLSRATLNAVLKYPWPRNLDDRSTKEYRKFGAYQEDLQCFDWARDGWPAKTRSLEAEIMDYADDIAYSVHDIIDFYRAGLLPLGTLYREADEYDAFIESWEKDKSVPLPQEIQAHPKKYKRLLGLFLVHRHYVGTRDQRASLRLIATAKIRQYDKAGRTQKVEGGYVLKRNPAVDLEIAFLKRVFYHYLISNPRLTTMQYGQRGIIRNLFAAFYRAMGSPDLATILPGRFLDLYQGLQDRMPKPERARLACDIVSSLTDSQALALFRRLNGNEPGEISDIVAW
jgi:dGTPase